jgi:hypothetical protein
VIGISQALEADNAHAASSAVHTTATEPDLLQRKCVITSRGDCRVDGSTACYRNEKLTKTKVRRDTTYTVIRRTEVLKTYHTGAWNRAIASKQ